LAELHKRQTQKATGASGVRHYAVDSQHNTWLRAVRRPSVVATTLIPALRRQRQGETQCESEASLLYRVSSRTATATQRNGVSETKTTNRIPKSCRHGSVLKNNTCREHEFSSRHPSPGSPAPGDFRAKFFLGNLKSRMHTHTHRHRHRHTHTHTHTHRDTHRHTQRHTHTHRHTQRHTHTQTHTETHTETHTYTHTHTQRHTDTQRHTQRHT